MPLPDVIGTITVDPPDPHDLVTKRTASVVLNGSSPLMVDMADGSGSFACQVNQAYVIGEIDSNAIGNSLPASISGIVPGFATVPKTATGLAVTFAPAP